MTTQTIRPVYTLTSEHEFAAGHYLKGHTGKCRNLHGHNYRVVIEVAGETLQEDGSSRSMVVDFYDIKKAFRGLVDSFDHSAHIENPKYTEPTHDYVDVTIGDVVIEKSHIIWLPFRPTAENYSKYFYEALKKDFPEIYAVTVYETPINASRYNPQA